MGVRQPPIASFTIGQAVPQSNPVQVEYPHRQNHIQPVDSLAAGALRRPDLTDVVVASSGIQIGPIRENEPQGQQRFGCEPIVIVPRPLAIGPGGDHSGSVNDTAASVTNTSQRSGLQRDPARYPPLRCGADSS